MVSHQAKLTHVFWSFSQVSMLTASSILSKQGEEYIHYYCCKKCQALFKSVPELLEHGKSCIGAKVLDTGGRFYAYQSSFLKGFVECILTCGHTDNCPLLMRNEITPEDGPTTVTNVVARDGLVIVTTADETGRNEDAAGAGKPAATGQAPGKDLAFDDNSGADDSDVYDPMADDDYSDDSMPERAVQGTPVTRSRLKATEDQENAKASTSQKGPSTRCNNKSKENKEHVTLKKVTPQRTPTTRWRGEGNARKGQGEEAATVTPARSTPTTRSKRKANSVEEPHSLIATRSHTTPANDNTVQKTPGTRSKAKGVEGHETPITSKTQKYSTASSRRNVNTNGKQRNLDVTSNASPAQKTAPDSASSRVEPTTPIATRAQQTPTTASKVTKKQGHVTTLSAGVTVQKTPVATPTTATPLHQTPTTSSNIRVKVITKQGNTNVITDAFLRKTTPAKTPVNEPKAIEEPENEAVKAIIAQKYRPIRPRPPVTAEPQNVAMRLAVVPQSQENIAPNPKVNAGQESADSGLNVSSEQESSNSVKEASVEQENEMPTTNASDKTGKDAPESKENAEQQSVEVSAEQEIAVLKLKVTNVQGNVTEFPTAASMESNELHDVSSSVSNPTCTGGNKQKSPKEKVGHNVKSQSVDDQAGSSVAKEYTCQWCDYKTDSTTGLEHHMKIHLRRKLWQCVVCGHEDVTERKMSAHVEQKHVGCRFEDAAIRIGLQEKEPVPDKDQQSEQFPDISSIVTKPTCTGSSETSDQAKEDEGDDSVLESMPEYDDIELIYNITDQPMTESDGEALVEYGDPSRGDHCYGLVPNIKQEPLEETIKQKPLEETTQLDTTIKYQVRKALPPHKCNHCFYRTWNKLRFLKHVRGHSIVEQQPSVLAKLALKASNLKDRWYGCPRCQFETGHAGSFRKHMMVHLGIQPWECAICGKRGITQQQIQLHIKWKHKDHSVEYLKDAAVKHDMEFNLNLYDYRIPNVGRHAAGNKQKSPKGKVKVGHNVKSQSVSYQAGASRAKEYACQWCDYKTDSTTGLEHHLMSHVRSNLWQCVVCGHEDATEIKMSAHVEQKHVGCRFEDAAIRIGLQEKEAVPDKDNQESSSQQAEPAVWGDNLYTLTTVGSEVHDGRTVNTMSLETPENRQILLEVASEETATYVPITDPGINFAIAGHSHGTFIPMADPGANFAVAGPSHVPLPEADWQFNATPSTSEEYFTIEMFGCDLCDFKIGNATRFKQHMLSHQGIKPWQCKICGAGDANKFNVAFHVKSFHRDSIAGKPMKFIDDMSKAVDIDLESYKIVCKRRRTKKK